MYKVKCNFYKSSPKNPYGIDLYSKGFFFLSDGTMRHLVTGQATPAGDIPNHHGVINGMRLP